MIYIIGNSRSGTTMMGRILGLNPDIHTFQEIHFFERMVATNDLSKEISKSEALSLLKRLISIQEQSFYRQENTEQYTKLSSSILSHMNEKNLTPIALYLSFLSFWAVNNGRILPCEQTPKNLYYIEEILHHDKSAKIINMVRDPRAISIAKKQMETTIFRRARNAFSREPARLVTLPSSNYYKVMDFCNHNIKKI